MPKRNAFTLLLFVHSFLGSEKIARLLIEKGAEVNTRDKENGSALNYAAFNGNKIQYLDHTFEINKYQFNVTHTGHESIVELLLENGANIDAINMFNNTPLITAIFTGIPQTYTNILYTKKFERLKFF